MDCINHCQERYAYYLVLICTKREIVPDPKKSGEMYKKSYLEMETIIESLTKHNRIR